MKAKRYCVIVEPRLALFRYIAVAKNKYETIVLTRDPRACAANELNQYREMGLPQQSLIDKLIECNTGSAAAILEALGPLASEVAAFVPADEPAISVTADVARQLGFDVPPPEDVIAQHIKTEMKARFAERNVPTARFRVVKSLEQAIEAWAHFNKSCIIKMVDYASSINVFWVNTEDEVRHAWLSIVENRGGKVRSQLPLRAEALVEECVFGRELSVEGYVSASGITLLNSCEKLTEKNFQIVGHFVPSQLSARDAVKVHEAARACVSALGVRNSVFHLEVHLKNDQPFVIECAARPPGHHVCELIKGCYGFDLMEINLELAAGRDPAVVPTQPSKHYGIFVLYAKRSGTLERITGLDELRRRTSLEHLSVSVSPGDNVRALASPDERYGIVVLSDPTPEGVRREASWLRENVNLIVSGAE